MRPLIAIHSCDQDTWNGRYNTIMSTWANDAVEFADLLFFKGRGPAMSHEIVLDCFDGNGDLIEKEQAMFRWIINNTDNERILKTETDVWFNVKKLFAAPHEDADVIGRLVGHKFGETYADSSFYCFIQGHAMWYSRKAMKLVADNLEDFYAAKRPNSHWRQNTLDPSRRAADLWGSQILTNAWLRGEITMRDELGFADGPLSYHFQGDSKHLTPEWMRAMDTDGAARRDWEGWKRYGI